MATIKNKKITPYYFLIFLLTGHLFLAGAIHAAPTGSDIVHGTASISQNDTTTLIQQYTNKLSINWDSFNINSNETVRFAQPTKSSIALNTILDQNPSEIFGSIESNGKIFLTNPNGIFFAPGATLNVGGLVAAGMHMNNENFIDGNYNFENSQDGQAGYVINYGTLNAASGGSINLLGGVVENHGLIAANYGQVNLISGNKIVVDFEGDQLIQFSVNENVLTNAEAFDSSIANTGQINANGGQVLLSGNVAQDLFSNSVNNEGIINAMRIDNSGGIVRLLGTDKVIHSGSINATGEGDSSSGGSVHIIGNKTGLFDNSTIYASGNAGGGEVLVGGDFQGNNSEIQNSEFTYVSENSKIEASAITNGDGGKVIVWADNSTQFYGTIEAKGGSESGNGGFAEVSGKKFLAYQGHTDVTASNGSKGTLLLDPRNITITSTATTLPGQVTDNDEFTDNSNATSNINNVDLVNAIDTSHVILQAHTDITFDATGVVDASAGNANNLTLIAGDDVIINANVTLATNATLSILAGETATAVPVGADGTANISGTGTLSASIIHLEASGTVGTNTTDLSITTTDLSITSGENFYINNSANLSDLNITDFGGTSGNLSSTDLTTFSLTSNGTNISNFAIDDDGLNLSLTNTGTIALNDIRLGNGNFAINSDSTISQIGTGGGKDIREVTNLVKGGTGALILSETNLIFGTHNINAGSISISNVDQIGAGAINLDNNGELDITNSLTLTNAINIGAGDGTIDTNANDVTASGQITSAVGSDLSKMGSGALTLSSTSNASLAGALNINGGSVSISSASNIGTGAISLDGTTLDISGAFELTNAINIGANDGTIDTNANDVTASGQISGIVGNDLTKIGTGALTLSNANTSTTHAGALNINEGSVSIASASNIGTGAIGLNGGELDITNSFTLANAINIGANDGTIDTNANDVNASGQITSAVGSDLSKMGSGALTLSSTANATRLGALNINEGSVSISSTNNIGTGTIVLNGGELDITTSFTLANAINIGVNDGTIDTNANDVTASGQISGIAGNDLTKIGIGTLTLSNANTSATHAGALNINEGSVSINRENYIGTGAIVLNGGELDITGNNLTLNNTINVGVNDGTIDTNANNVTASGQITSAVGSDLIKMGSGELRLSSANNATRLGALNINEGSVRIASASNIGTGDINLDNNGELDITGNLTLTNAINIGANDGTINTRTNDVTASGQITSAVGSDLSKRGSGVLTLSSTANATRLGALNINQGSVSISSTNNIGTGAIGLNGGELDITNSFTLANAINIGANDGTIDTNANNVTASGQISGIVGNDLTKIGTGALTLSNANTSTTHAGALNINEGSVSIASANSIGTGAIVLNGGELDITNSLTLTNAINIGANDGTIDTNANDANASGQITSAVGSDLSKMGSGALTLSSTSNASLAGALNVNEGSVSISSTNNIGTGTIVLNGGELDITTSFTLANAINIGVNDGTIDTNANDVTASGQISGIAGNDLTKIGTGALTLSNTNTSTTHAGALNINEGSVSISSASNIGTGAIGLNGGELDITNSFTLANAINIGANDGTIDTNANNVTASGQITSAVGSDLSKLGSGELRLSSLANASHNGDTIINGGTLTIDGGGITNSGTVVINNGSTLFLEFPTTLRDLTINEGVLDGRINSTSLTLADLNVAGDTAIFTRLDMSGDINHTAGQLNLWNQISIEGDINNSGGILNANRDIFFDGSADQNINTLANAIFRDLKINKSGGDLFFNDSFNARSISTSFPHTANISFLGDNTTFSNSSSIASTGNLLLGDSSTDIISFNGGLNRTNGNTIINGQLQGSAGLIDLAGTTQLFGSINNGSSAINIDLLDVENTTSITGGTLTISDTVLIKDNRTLTLNGTNISLEDVVGEQNVTNPGSVSNLTVNGSGLLTLNNNIGSTTSGIGLLDITARDIDINAAVIANKINIEATGNLLVLESLSDTTTLTGTSTVGTITTGSSGNSMVIDATELNFITVDDNDAGTTADLLTLESDSLVYLSGDINYTKGDNGLELNSGNDLYIGGLRWTFLLQIFGGVTSTDWKVGDSDSTLQFEALSATATNDIYTFEYSLLDINGNLSLDAGNSLFLNSNPFLAVGADNGIALDANIQANNIAFSANTPVVINDPLSIEAVGTGNIDFSGLDFIRGSTSGIDAAFTLTTNGGDIRVGDIGTEATPIDSVTLDALGTSAGPAGTVFLNGDIYTNDFITIAPSKTAGIVLEGDSTLATAGLLNLSAIDGSHNSASNGFGLTIVSDSSTLVDITDISNLSVISTSTSAETTISSSLLEAGSITLDGLFSAASALNIRADDINITGSLENAGGNLTLTADTVTTNADLITDKDLIINSDSSTLQGQLQATNIDLSNANQTAEIIVNGTGLAIQADSVTLGGALLIGGTTTGITLADSANLDFSGVSSIEFTSDANFQLTNGDLNFGAATFVDNTLGGVDLNIVDTASAVGGGTVTLSTINDTVRSVNVETVNNLQLAGSIKTLDGISLISSGGTVETNSAAETILESSQITLGGDFITNSSSIQLINSGAAVNLDAGSDLDLSKIILNGDLTNPVALNIDSNGYLVTLGETNANNINLTGNYALEGDIKTSAANAGINFSSNSTVAINNDIVLDTFTNNPDGIGGSVYLGDNVIFTGNTNSLTVISGTGFNMENSSQILLTNSNLDITTETGNIMLNTINTGDGNVNLNAKNGSVLSAFAPLSNSTISSQEVNLSANQINIEAGDKIGLSSSNPIIIDAINSIALDLGASEAYILNLSNAPVTSNDTVIDVYNDRFEASYIAEATGSRSVINFLDYDFYLYELPNIVNVLSSSDALNDEDDIGDTIISTLTPEVPALIKTLKGWSFVRANRNFNNSTSETKSSRSNESKNVEWLKNEFRY